MPTLLEPQTMNPNVRQAARIRALETRVAELESRGAIIPVVAGTPAAGTGTEGSQAGDTSAVRLWLKLGGTWRYVALT